MRSTVSSARRSTAYSVWRLYADDQWIENLIERWQNRYGEKRVLVWRTNRPRQIAWAVRNFEQAIHGQGRAHAFR
jgi:hypothetical protein